MHLVAKIARLWARTLTGDWRTAWGASPCRPWAPPRSPRSPRSSCSTGAKRTATLKAKTMVTMIESCPHCSLKLGGEYGYTGKHDEQCIVSQARRLGFLLIAGQP